MPDLTIIFINKTLLFCTMANKTIIGLTETVTIYGNGKNKKIKAKIDTGATKSSIDIKLAKELHLGPIIKSRMVKSAHGTKLRPVVEGKIMLAKRKIDTEFTLAARDHMKYRVLIGQNALKKHFLINPSKE
jgi:hypothetical protein